MRPETHPHGLSTEDMAFCEFHSWYVLIRLSQTGFYILCPATDRAGGVRQVFAGQGAGSNYFPFEVKESRKLRGAFFDYTRTSKRVT
jgi:hypothetical protein